MPHRYRETSLQCLRTTSTELLHATLAGLGPWARSHITMSAQRQSSQPPARIVVNLPRYSMPSARSTAWP